MNHPQVLGSTYKTRQKVKRMPQHWLRDLHNQQALLAISEQVIAVLAPLETPLLQGIVEDYVMAAQQGSVTAGSQPEEAFGFAGESELLSLHLVPLIASVISHLLRQLGTASVQQLSEHFSREQILAELTGQADRIQAALPPIPAGERERWNNTIISALIRHLAQEPAGRARNMPDTAS